MVAARLTATELSTRLRALPAAPKDAGRVAHVLVRRGPSERIALPCATLTPAEGVVGDRWSEHAQRSVDAQISVMQVDVLEVLADGESLELAGDNLLVHLDLSRGNLPAGARVAVGSAICEVTPKPHTGCRKFAARYGQAAREVMDRDEFDAWRLRGIFLRVVEAGEVSRGDEVRVVSRDVAPSVAAPP